VRPAGRTKKKTEEYDEMKKAGYYHKIVKKHIKIKLIGNKR
jgi:hypothetical protein